jgi:adhesin transport system outer membrane protein
MPDALEEPASVKDQLPATVDEATEKALQTNATLQSAREDVEAAFAQRDAAKNTYYPHINLELHRSWDRDNNGIDGEDHDTSAFVRMRYNIYNGGSDKARVRETADLINEAKDIRNNTHRELVESMRLAWTAYQAAELQREYLEQHVVDTRQTRDAYLKQFNIGQRTLLDVLDTENELFDAKKAALDSHYDGVIGQYRVLRAMSMVAEVVDVELPKETTPIPSPRQERLAGSPEEE